MGIGSYQDNETINVQDSVCTSSYKQPQHFSPKTKHDDFVVSTHHSIPDWFTQLRWNERISLEHYVLGS